jgi:hypothetical protein
VGNWKINNSISESFLKKYVNSAVFIAWVEFVDGMNIIYSLLIRR